MRLLIEIVVAAGLIALTWGKPLREWMPGAKPVAAAAATPAPVAVKAPVSPKAAVAKPTPPPVVVATPAPTVSGAWMWDKDRRGPLEATSPARGKRP